MNSHSAYRYYNGMRCSNNLMVKDDIQKWPSWKNDLTAHAYLHQFMQLFRDDNTRLNYRVNEDWTFSNSINIANPSFKLTIVFCRYLEDWSSTQNAYYPTLICKSWAEQRWKIEKIFSMLKTIVSQKTFVHYFCSGKSYTFSESDSKNKTNSLMKI